MPHALCDIAVNCTKLITWCSCIAGDGHAEEHTSKPAAAAIAVEADQQLPAPADDTADQLHAGDGTEPKLAEAPAAAAHAEEAVAEKDIDSPPERRQKTGTDLQGCCLAVLSLWFINLCYTELKAQVSTAVQI